MNIPRTVVRAVVLVALAAGSSACDGNENAAVPGPSARPTLGPSVVQLTDWSAVDLDSRCANIEDAAGSVLTAPDSTWLPSARMPHIGRQCGGVLQLRYGRIDVLFESLRHRYAPSFEVSNARRS